MKKYKYLLLSILLITIASCSDDSYEEMVSGNKSFITLHLPTETTVEINTRAVSDENKINDVLVFTFRDGIAKYQSFTSPTVANGTVSFELSAFSIADGETLYVCCNTGVTTVDATNADDFFRQQTYTNNTTEMTMYSSTQISGSRSEISLELKRTFAKASLTCSDGSNTVKSWKLCNVPTKGFISETAGYPTDANFDETVTPASVIDAVYFIPRTDNNSTTENKTYMLVELDGRGWYKLDFHTGTLGSDLTTKPSVIDIQRNTHYAFDILAVHNNGYSSEAEAKANPGSNIVYSMSSIENIDSNGQYALEIDRDAVTLYPVAAGQQSMEALNISAIIPTGLDTDISTYTVRLINPSAQIKLDGDNDGDNLLDLKRAGEKITTDNSLRIIKLLFDGANTMNSFLEVKLGNMTRMVPISVLSSNCYLVDFSTATGTVLYIPIVQANLDGNTRISTNDDLDIDIVWSDQPDIDLKLEFQKDKQWIVVTNNSTFTGNVVISASHNSTVKWSWHIWSMDNNVIEYNTEKGIYDFNEIHTKKFNGFTFMDRNLGAYTLEKTAQGSWGLFYQWGRKDPFPMTEITNPATDQMIYYKTQRFTMTDGHPVLNDCFATVDNSPNNLEYSISHPLTFIEGIYYNGAGMWTDADWYTSDRSLRNNYLWLDKQRIKTAYNPCPLGWTSPYGGEVGPFVSLDNGVIEKEGMSFTSIGYVPFTPYRDERKAIINTNLSFAYLLWGNFKNNTMAVTYFSTSGVATNSTTRASAMPTRCVREIKE